MEDSLQHPHLLGLGQIKGPSQGPLTGADLHLTKNLTPHTMAEKES